MSNTKGQGVSINVIIVAAIALVVLIVLIAIFTGKIGVFSQEVGEVGEGVGTKFGADCHPNAALVQEYNAQKSVLESEIASLEAQGVSTASAEGQKDELVSNFVRLETACGEIKAQNSCSVPVSRGTLSGTCEWK